MGRFVLVALCSVVAASALCFSVHGRLGCKEGIECLSTELPSPNYGNEKEYFKGLKPLDRGAAAEDLFGSGLRWVPSGPDPLHHNGSPKKPQTP